MRKNLKALLGLSLLLSVLGGCNLIPDSELIVTQLDQLGSDLTSNRSNCYDSVHPDAVNYDASKSPSFWDTAIQATVGTYKFTIARSDEISAVTGTLTGPAYSKNFTAAFKKSGDKMKLTSLNLGSGDILN